VIVCSSPTPTKRRRLSSDNLIDLTVYVFFSQPFVSAVVEQSFRCDVVGIITCSLNIQLFQQSFEEMLLEMWQYLKGSMASNWMFHWFTLYQSAVHSDEKYCY